MHHLIKLAAHGAAFAQIVLRELPITEDRTEDDIESVRDTTGQPPDRLHFGRLLQSPLHLLALALLHSLHFLRASALSGVHHRPDKLEVARLAHRGTGNHLEMLDRTIGQQQSIIQIKILPLVAREIECLLKKIFVFGMRLLNHSREVRWGRWIKPKDPKGLRRPVDLSGCRIPAEAACVAQGLRLSQVSLAPPQGLFGSPTLAVLLLQGGYHREGQNDKCNAGHHQSQIGLIETCVSLGLENRAVDGKSGPLHRRVVHTGNGQAHDDGSNELLSKIRGSECQPECRRRRTDRYDQGECNEWKAVVDLGVRPHCRHADVMHGGNPKSHEDAAEYEGELWCALTIDEIKAGAGYEDRHNERKRG